MIIYRVFQKVSPTSGETTVLGKDIKDLSKAIAAADKAAAEAEPGMDCHVEEIDDEAPSSRRVHVAIAPVPEPEPPPEAEIEPAPENEPPAE